MSIYIKSPMDGQCCDCHPNVCDPCDSCPTTATISIVVSGILACCSASNTKMTGLGSVNGVYTLEQLDSGDYSTVISGAVSIDSYGAPDCTTWLSTAGPYDVTVAFSCSPDQAILDIRLTASMVRLFYGVITPPAPSELFVFDGGTSCSSFTPYTYGGTGTMSE